MDVELTKLGERGQTVIPKSIREKIVAKKGTLFSVFLMDDDTIVLRRVDKRRFIEEHEDLKGKIKKIFSNAKIMEELGNI